MFIADAKRYEKMTYRKCGNSGIKLPAISLGLWHNFGRLANVANMRNMIFTAFDEGICHFDLANNYGPEPGDAEINFGRILNSDLCVYRDEIIISSKAGYRMWPGHYGDGGSRKYLIASIDASLKRMGIDYVDIFYSHRFDSETPLEETMDALSQIVKSGKAIYAGISSYNPEQTRFAAQLLKESGTPFLIHQPHYNMLDRTCETSGLFEELKRLGKGAIVFCPLAQGVLTEKYLKDIPADSRFASNKSYLQNNILTKETHEKLMKLNDFAKMRGQTLPMLALAWVLRDEVVTSALIGASKVEQILENLKALDNTNFTSEELAIIDGILA